MEYLNTGSHLGTGSTTVLSASTTTKYLVKTVHATNVFSADTSFNLSWVDNSGSQTYTTIILFSSIRWYIYFR